MLQLLEQICRIMDTLRVPYMLSGSVAMNLYAEPRTTQDIDIIVEMMVEDISNFIKLLDDRFYYSEEAIYEAIQRKSMFNVIDFHTGMKVDLIIRSGDLFEQEKFHNRRKTNYQGIDLWVISPEDLVVSKLRWIQELQSEKQKSDIANLLSSEGLNMEYIRKWCDILKLKTYKLL